MKITIIETTTKTFTAEHRLLATRVDEAYLIEPESGKCLKHKPTGRLFHTGICVDSEYKLSEYIEIEQS